MTQMPRTREAALVAISHGAMEVATNPLFAHFVANQPLGGRLVMLIENDGDPEMLANVLRGILGRATVGQAPGAEWFHNTPEGHQITDALCILEGVESRRELYQRLMRAS